MPVVVKRNETAFTGPRYNFIVTGNGLAARVFHTGTPDMSGHINFNVSGRGSKTRSAEIVAAVKTFLADEDNALGEFLNTPETPAPVVPFSAEVDAALSLLAAGDYYGAAVIRESLFQIWRPGVIGVHEALDRLSLLAADVLNVNVVIRQDWAAWLEAGPLDDRRQTSTLAPAFPTFKTFTDFTPGKHLQCAVCGFEAIYTDARRRTVSYIIADGLTVDTATTERDATVKQSDFTGISCNRTGCDWTGPVETLLTADDIRGINAWVSSRMAAIPAGYETAAFIETGHYRHHVAMSDAFADRTDDAGAEHCRCYMRAAAESLQRLQAWAVDPAAYDFSELAGVTA